MTDEFQNFIAKSAEIAVQQMEGIKGGKVYATLQSIGIFLPPDTKPHILNRKCVEVLSADAWEVLSLAHHAKHQAPAVKPAESNPTINPVNIDRS